MVGLVRPATRGDDGRGLQVLCNSGDGSGSAAVPLAARGWGGPVSPESAPPAVGEFADIVQRLRQLTREHSTRFERAIPLIASENLLSPYAKELLISDLHSRYAEGLPGDRYYEGNEQVDEIENLVLDLARR